MAAKIVQYRPEENVSTSTELMNRLNTKVFLILNNCLLPEFAIKEAPSQAWQSINIETETDRQIIGRELIQTAGIMLKLPQVAIATGQMYFRRFYDTEWLRGFPVVTMAMGSIGLAANLQGNPRRILDIINVFHHIQQVQTKKTLSPLVVDGNYVKVKFAVEIVAICILIKLGLHVYITKIGSSTKCDDGGRGEGNDFLSSAIVIDVMAGNKNHRKQC